MPTLEGLGHTGVLCVDCLPDGGPDLIDAVANGVQPETSHLLIVACATCCCRGPCELHAQDVRNCSLPGPVVGEIHQVAENEQCLPCGSRPAAVAPVRNGCQTGPASDPGSSREAYHAQRAPAAAPTTAMSRATCQVRSSVENSAERPAMPNPTRAPIAALPPRPIRRPGSRSCPVHVLGERTAEDDYDQTDHAQGESDRIELDHARARVIGPNVANGLHPACLSVGTRRRRGTSPSPARLASALTSDSSRSTGPSDQEKGDDTVVAGARALHRALLAIDQHLVPPGDEGTRRL